MTSPFTLLPSEKDVLVTLLWGPVVARHYSPVNATLCRLFKRHFLGRCIRCGRTRIEYGGERVCPVHELEPGFGEQYYPVNPKH